MSEAGFSDTVSIKLFSKSPKIMHACNLIMACPFVTEHGQIFIYHFIIAHTKMNENPRLDSSS
jgi:hypothetical protein